MKLSMGLRAQAAFFTAGGCVRFGGISDQVG